MRANTIPPCSTDAAARVAEAEAALAKNTATLSEIQAILAVSGPRVAVKDMRVTDYEG